MIYTGVLIDSMPAEDIAVFLGLIIILAHFFSDRIGNVKGRFLSFATGISVTYIFLYLFPEAMRSTLANSFIFVLLGFVVMRVLEVHIRRHRSPHIMKRELKELHAALFFVYHFIIGVVLFGILSKNIIAGMLFFFPVMFHSIISSASLPELHERIKGISKLRFVLSMSTLLGISVSIIVSIPQILDTIALGFVTGALLYIIIRDSMPKETKSKPLYFLFGVILYTILITLTGFFQ